MTFLIESMIERGSEGVCVWVLMLLDVALFDCNKCSRSALRKLSLIFCPSGTPTIVLTFSPLLKKIKVGMPRMACVLARLRNASLLMRMTVMLSNSDSAATSSTGFFICSHAPHQGAENCKTNGFSDVIRVSYSFASSSVVKCALRATVIRENSAIFCALAIIWRSSFVYGYIVLKIVIYDRLPLCF